jgi:tetratricopeptide (TPR) repeat protein
VLRADPPPGGYVQGMAWILALLGCPRPTPLPPRPVDAAEAGAQARQFAVRSEVALAAGDHAEAARWAGWLLRVDPSAWAAIHAADVLRAAGDVDGAQAAAARAVAAAPELPEAHRILGLSLLDRGDPAAAAEALARAADLPGVWAARIDAAAALGRLDEAERILDAWTPRGPSEALGWARSALRVGRRVAARDGALGLAHDPLVGPDALALAVRAGQQACDLAPVYAWSRDHAGRTADPRWREALLALAASAADPALARTVTARSGDRPGEVRARLDAGDAEGAAALVRPDDPPWLRARLALALGEPDEAMAALQGATDPASVAALADRYLASGDAHAALAVTEGAASDASVAWVRAGALAILGRTGEAVGLVVQTAADPLDAAVREAAVRALTGDDAGAEATLRRALREAPADACPVALWMALAERAPPCEAATLLASAARVRVADRALAEAESAARVACPALRER